MNTEKWIDVPGFINYKISTLGRVISKARTRKGKSNMPVLLKERVMKSFETKSGYMQIRLRKNGKYYNVLIHRAVAEAFIPNPDNLPCVNHKDENRKNNTVSNLEWCSYLYNNNYGNRNAKISLSKKAVKS